MAGEYGGVSILEMLDWPLAVDVVVLVVLMSPVQLDDECPKENFQVRRWTVDCFTSRMFHAALHRAIVPESLLFPAAMFKQPHLSETANQ